MAIPLRLPWFVHKHNRGPSPRYVRKSENLSCFLALKKYTMQKCSLCICTMH